MVDVNSNGREGCLVFNWICCCVNKLMPNCSLVIFATSRTCVSQQIFEESPMASAFEYLMFCIYVFLRAKCNIRKVQDFCKSPNAVGPMLSSFILSFY